jgi:vacuolar-type H+-ATPase subunit E/Vma4
LPPTQFIYNKIISTLERRRTRLSKYPKIMKNTRKKYEEQVEINRRIPNETGCECT